jgi:tellurite resistance protein
MKLDDRLQRIATGMNVADAIERYLTEQAEPPPADPAQERREETLAIVEIMFLMAAVDGEVAPEEIAELRGSLMAVRDLDLVEDVTLEQALDAMNAKLEAEGWKARLDEAAARIRAPEARHFAFQLAAGVAFVDDFVAHAEAAAIDTLARALELEPEDSQRLLREVHLSIFGEG